MAAVLASRFVAVPALGAAQGVLMLVAGVMLRVVIELVAALAAVVVAMVAVAAVVAAVVAVAAVVVAVVALAVMAVAAFVMSVAGHWLPLLIDISRYIGTRFGRIWAGQFPGARIPSRISSSMRSDRGPIQWPAMPMR